MLAARTSAVRSASRIARNFATVVDSAGVKVASVDNGEATSSVTFLVKAGSRFENKPGVAHALQNFAFKSTSKRSGLATVRATELYGGVLSSALSREHLALTAEFLRGDEEYFVDVLSSFITSAKFTRHELLEFVAPLCASESTAAFSNPATRAVELAHGLAFRNGLGAPLLATEHGHVDVDLVKSYASSVFGKGNIAVLGTGISQEALTKLVERSLGSLSAAASPATTPTSYHGGETRVDSHGGAQTVFIGFGTAGSPSAELAALAAHLNPQPSVKWSEGLSPLASSIPQGSSVQTVFLPYSDATLFGLLVQGETAEDVKVAGKAAVAALKEASNVKAEDLKKAVAKAKFAVASSTDSRSGLVSVLGSKVLAGASASLNESISALEKVDASAFAKATSSLLKAKPTYVAVGDVKALPYADDLGL
ncbi:Metalloenzyme, LuxS/M16 peptidase-like protein [Cytidiella melzeri]|nr:Metalloenzyme, LuxS/M16 peptidase-like protein [Cytidiella melzeri]